VKGLLNRSSEEEKEECPKPTLVSIQGICQRALNSAPFFEIPRFRLAFLKILCDSLDEKESLSPLTNLPIWKSTLLTCRKLLSKSIDADSDFADLKDAVNQFSLLSKKNDTTLSFPPSWDTIENALLLLLTFPKDFFPKRESQVGINSFFTFFLHFSTNSTLSSPFFDPHLYFLHFSFFIFHFPILPTFGIFSGRAEYDSSLGIRFLSIFLFRQSGMDLARNPSFPSFKKALFCPSGDRSRGPLSRYCSNNLLLAHSNLKGSLKVYLLF